MHRLLVALLAALDAVIAAAVGVAAALAPLTLLWVFGMGAPVWSALWPASAAVWQLGHLVPQTLALPSTYLAAAGIPPQAASFTLSLAPLAFACFTAAFAARSGRRAALSGAWATGVASGTVVFAIVAAGVWLTSRTAISTAHGWQAVLLPVLVFAVPALIGAVVTAWSDGDGGVIDRLHDRVDGLSGTWRDVPALAVRGLGIVVAGLAGLGAVIVVVGLIARGGETIALYEAGHMDVVGVVVVSLVQLAFLPTLVVWGLSFVAGPGFAVGAGTAVSPSGTELGVVPGIPILGILPGSSSPWMLALIVLPIGVAAFAGWVLRSRLAASGEIDAVAPRLVLTLAVAVLSGATAALLAAAASGSIGPERLAQTGPEPGPVALAVGVEVLVGVGILLLSPRRQGDLDLPDTADAAPLRGDDAPVWSSPVFATDRDDPTTADARHAASGTPVSVDDTETAPIDPGFLAGGSAREGERPPID